MPDSSWFTNRIYARPLIGRRPRRAARTPSTARPPASGPSSAPRPLAPRPASRCATRRATSGFSRWTRAAIPSRRPAAIAVATRCSGRSATTSPRATSRRCGPRTSSSATRSRCRRTASAAASRSGPQGRVRAREQERGRVRIALLAQRGLPGRVIGGFKYFGTRPDDPNDIVPHEHRRELRALQVFGAWTNLVDMKAGNTLDTVITENGRSRRAPLPAGRRIHVRHRLARPARRRRGTRARRTRERRQPSGSSLSASTSAVADARLRGAPGDRPFHGRAFEPEKWKPRVPAAALLRVRPTTRCGRRCG